MMTCPNCKAINDIDANFCKNCGNSFSDLSFVKTDTPDKSAFYLSILIGWLCFTGLIWFFVQQVIVPQMIKNMSNSMRIGSFYSMLSIPLEIITVIMAIVFAALAKNNMARIALFIFAAVRIFISVGSFVIPLMHTWR